MNIHGAIRRHYRTLVAAAPYREPPVTPAPEARTDRGLGQVFWPLGCVAALALMLLLPAGGDRAAWENPLARRVERTLSSGVVREYGQRAIQVIAQVSPFRVGSIQGGSE